MADVETKRIIEIESKFDTLADLHGAITTANEDLSKLTRGTAEYEKGLADLKTAQNRYNENMRLAVKENSTAKGSYNDLVNQLNRLKQEWNNTGDAMRRTALTQQINDVKEQIADLDHSIGNWQRNVGNYSMAASSSLGTFKDVLEKGLLSTADLKGGVENLGLSMKLLSTNPLFAVISLLMPVLTDIAGKMKENETAIESINKLGKLFEPVGKTIGIIVDKIAEGLASATEWIVSLGREGNGTFGNLIAGATGVGNVILQALLAPVKAVIEGVKGLGKMFGDIFRGNWGSVRQDAALAGKAIGDAFRDGFSFKANFAQGQETGVALMERINSQPARDKAKETGGALGDAMVEGLVEHFDFDKTLSRLEKKAEDWKRALAEGQGISDALLAEMDAEVQAGIDALAQEGLEALQDSAEDGKASWLDYKDAVVSILDDVAGAWQNSIKAQVDAGKISAQEGEKQFKNVKALQYAVTWINTLAAMTSALADPTAPSFAVKLANAASAFTTGLANTIKIANTSLGNTQTSSATGQGVQSAQSFYSPNQAEQTATTRIVTNAQDEERLNSMLSAQPVYLVTSELEGWMKGRKAQLQESGF